MFDEPAGRRAKIIAAIGVIVLAIGLVVGLVIMAPRHNVETPEGVEAELARNPSLRDMVSAMKSLYPQDYAAMVRRIATAGRERGRDAASTEVTRALREFLRSKVNAVAAAPARDLQRLAGAQLGLARALRDENIALCAKYAVRGLDPSDRLSSAGIAMLSRVSVITLEAAHAGERSSERPRPAPSVADINVWIARVRTIDPAAATIFENDTVARATPDRQCQAGVAIFQALNELPGEMIARLTAQIVRDSAGRL